MGIKELGQQADQIRKELIDGLVIVKYAEYAKEKGCTDEEYSNMKKTAALNLLMTKCRIDEFSKAFAEYIETLNK